MIPRALSPNGEAEWQRFERQLIWPAAGGVVFLFVSDPQLTEELQRRLQARCQTLGQGLNWLKPLSPASLLDETERLLVHGALSNRAALAIEVNAIGAVWDQVRNTWLQHLDAYHPLAPPLLLLLPSHFFAEVGHWAVDLWSTRQAIGVFDTVCLNNPPPAQPIPAIRPALLDDAHWQAWQQQSQSVAPPSRDSLKLGWEVCEAALQSGQLDLAASVAATVLGGARYLATQHPSSNKALRDLSISLNRVGNVALAQGNWDTAHSAYLEGLALRRECRQRLGDSPQTLRDLSLSLNRLGDLAQLQSRWDDATAAYAESLQLRRLQYQKNGDTTEVLRDLSVVLERLGDLAQTRQRYDDAALAYAENLHFSRMLYQRSGHSPVVMQDLIIALNKVAGLAQRQGRWDEAAAAYAESLQCQREQQQRSGATVERLHTLSQTSRHASEVAQAQGRWQKAEGVLRDAIADWQRLSVAYPQVDEYRRQAQRLEDKLAALRQAADVARAHE